MSVTTNQAEKLHSEEKALRGRIEQRHEAGLLAFKALCGAEFNVPQDLAEAAALANRLKKERDELRKQMEEVNNRVTELNQKATTLQESVAKGFQELTQGEPEGANKPGLAAVADLIARLRLEKHLAENEAKIAAHTLTQAFIEMGLTRVPVALNAFIGQTPLAVAVEGAAIYLFGDDTAKQKYLRRRGWKFVGNGAWQGGKGTVPFQSAVKMQVETDVMPYKGLGHRAYEPAAQPETAK